MRLLPFSPDLCGQLVLVALLFFSSLSVGWATPDPGDVRINSLGTEFLPLPSPPTGPRRLLARWPVRVQDYRVFAEATGTSWPRPEFVQEDDHPAVNVSWEDAVRFALWLTRHELAKGLIPPGARYRLPTETEWMLGLLGPLPPGQRPPAFPWGDSWPPPDGFGNYGALLQVDAFDFTSPVTAFPANERGFQDMSGNVWEWTGDTYQGSIDLRVLKGGSWRMRSASDLMSTAQVGNVVSLRLTSYGFRLLLELPEEP